MPRSARPLDTDGLHLGRPPEDAPTKVAQIMFPQNTRANPLIDRLAPQLAELPVAGGLGAIYVPGLTSLVQGDTPFLDSEIPSVNAVVTARGLAKMYGALANSGQIDGTQFLSIEVGGWTAGQDQFAAGPEHGVPDVVPPRLPRITGAWTVARIRPRWPGRDHRVG